jgi:hypothetical protein
MELPVAVSNLVETVRATTKFDTKLMPLLKSTKIHLTILAGKDGKPELLVKLLPIVAPKPRKSPAINSVTAEKIKMAKLMFKSNSDALYLFTLLARVKEYTDKLKLKNLTHEGAEMVKEEFNEVMGSLNKVNKMLIKL